MAKLEDGDAKILDCPHEFGNVRYVFFDNRWRMVMMINRPEIGKVFAGGENANHCHVCGRALYSPDTRIRNHVLGALPVLDVFIQDWLTQIEAEGRNPYIVISGDAPEGGILGVDADGSLSLHEPENDDNADGNETTEQPPDPGLPL